MKIDIKELGGSSVLAGALNGRAMLNRLLDATSAEAAKPIPIFLDFSGIEVATASFLRESILAFRNIVRGRRSQYYPLVANADPIVQDELLEILKPRGDVLMTCILTEDGTVGAAMPLGELDPKQRLTFDLVHERGETDAGALMRDFGESEGVKHTTAWNNRLASLAALGLIIEQSQGRSKRYRPLFEGT
ncbi:hypothetical protein [Azospirillum agricola]|uniref:hypothetical protein n=1 Tax=Azospirillum agricola TaxID=1720247 RepID=UPI000A0F0268|nr:hypothetical protein [Azospirillum agricola]SMH62823.1 hypothetical protein SAMN02982994_6646 [Azospirillum lipoferum]